MSRFDDATAVTRTGQGRYTAELDPGYLIGSALNGGYLMAVMQRAALAEASHPHAVSSSFHFLRPGRPGPAEIETDILKTGRTVTGLRVLLSQNGAPVVAGLLSGSSLEETASPVFSEQTPPLPPLENCAAFDPRRGHGSTDAPFVDRMELRFTEDSAARLRRSNRDHEPELLGYTRSAEGDPADPAAFLPLAVDSLPPVVMVLEGWSWAPTVELTWHMRAVPAPGPLVFRSRSGAVGDGWFDETVDLWDGKGRLVAQSRQLARIGR